MCLSNLKQFSSDKIVKAKTETETTVVLVAKYTLAELKLKFNSWLIVIKYLELKINCVKQFIVEYQVNYFFNGWKINAVKFSYQ